MAISTLGYVILALLARGPLSGYDLAQRMNKPIGYFWQAQRSQIYPELAQLEEQGFVVHQVIVQQDRPNKKLYALTEAGQAALKVWVTTPPIPTSARSELLVKTYAIWLADPAAASALFRTQEQVHAERLALFQHIQSGLEQRSGGIPGPAEPCFGDYATVRLGVSSERESVAWCRWMVEQLDLAVESQGQTNERETSDLWREAQVDKRVSSRSQEER